MKQKLNRRGFIRRIAFGLAAIPFIGTAVVAAKKEPAKEMWVDQVHYKTGLVKMRESQFWFTSNPQNTVHWTQEQNPDDWEALDETIMKAVKDRILR